MLTRSLAITASLISPFLWASIPSIHGSEVPSNLVVEGIPAIPDEVKNDAARYLEFRSAVFQGWRPMPAAKEAAEGKEKPAQPEALILTRFGNTPQIHRVAAPGGARKQATFLAQPVGQAHWQPVTGQHIVFSQDVGGGENYQLFRLDATDGRITRLTDGKSRNTEVAWSPTGKQIAYCSTRRTGKDTDIWIQDPKGGEEAAKIALERSGGGWAVLDWSADEKRLLLANYISISRSTLHVLDIETKQLTDITPETIAAGESKPQTEVAHAGGAFLPPGDAILTTSDNGSEFRQLVTISLATKEREVLSADVPWDVEEFALNSQGTQVAYVANEDGVSVLHVWDLEKKKAMPLPKLPLGVISGLEWQEREPIIGFSLSSARSPADLWAVNTKNGNVTRWTESETGGIDAAHLPEPELVRFPSFDQLPISGFLYRPDGGKFPGPRPVIISIHGGPEGQSRPIFQARNNYYLQELGCALLYPNVRGSEGYGKTFLSKDNGANREDSVKDIGAFLDWIGTQPGLDKNRILVMGGSYGGYMVLASLVHYSPRLKGGIDIVGISDFLTFLKNTADYRRDLRRVEYGDERDPKMAEHLKAISPLTNVTKIQAPLFVVQGANDPRVPASEAKQIFEAVKAQKKIAWFLMANDEGHGFQKKANQDFQFLSHILFLQETLLK